MSNFKKYVIALDEGTTSCRAVLYDKNGEPLGSKQREFNQIYPHPGWVEHDAEEIFKCQLKVLQSLLIENEIRHDEIAAIGGQVGDHQTPAERPQGRGCRRRPVRSDLCR